MTRISLREDIAELMAAYAHCLDDGELAAWPDFFTSDAWYRVVPRENFERDLPLSTLSLQGHGMMRDRLYGVESTIFHAPYYQRHILSQTHIVSHEDDTIEARTNYLVLRTKRDLPPEIFNTGVYHDRIVATPQGLKFAQRFCVFDNDLIPNSLIFPI
ncbi:aromatic-ring-hydroxylating dioxygenase subunit beta [Novosphingobium terrae]|uniref:aromatic-ring-hydroxylating dioxygenase subunit beta n=1 Tax=Novosphingobium terrae TaxID=2726189 RepID=UPI00197E565A|nr:aromatic-ring-hydroxylating dioxygenase subunit beta [Novosphingobium terrae]